MRRFRLWVGPEGVVGGSFCILGGLTTGLLGALRHFGAAEVGELLHNEMGPQPHLSFRKVDICCDHSGAHFPTASRPGPGSPLETAPHITTPGTPAVRETILTSTTQTAFDARGNVMENAFPTASLAAPNRFTPQTNGQLEPQRELLGLGASEFAFPAGDIRPNRRSKILASQDLSDHFFQVCRRDFQPAHLNQATVPLGC